MSPIPSNRYAEAIFAIGIIKKVTGGKTLGGCINPPPGRPRVNLIGVMPWRLIVDTEVSRETADGTQFIPAFLSSVNVVLFNDEDEDLKEQVDVAIDMVNRRLTDFGGQGNGWQLRGIDRVASQCSKHSPITGSSYIPTPKFLEGRKAIVNVENVNDDLCFFTASSPKSIQ